MEDGGEVATENGLETLMDQDITFPLAIAITITLILAIIMAIIPAAIAIITLLKAPIITIQAFLELVPILI